MTQLKTAFEQVLASNAVVLDYATQGTLATLKGLDGEGKALMAKEMPVHVAGLLTQNFEALAAKHAGTTVEFTPHELAEKVVAALPHMDAHKPSAIKAWENALPTMLPPDTSISLSETRGGSLAMKGDKITLKGFTPQYGGCC